MAKQIGIRPQARLDVVELATYIGRQSTPAADRFLDACQATFTLLSESPGIGAFYQVTAEQLSALRVFRVQGFPNHLIFYLERPAGIEIVRVLHDARDLDSALQDA